MTSFREEALTLAFANEETIYELTGRTKKASFEMQSKKRTLLKCITLIFPLHPITGCKYSCHYSSFSSKVTFENKFSGDPDISEANFTVQVSIMAT